jgi:hypothetical protein
LRIATRGQDLGTADGQSSPWSRSEEALDKSIEVLMKLLFEGGFLTQELLLAWNMTCIVVGTRGVYDIYRWSCFDNSMQVTLMCHYIDVYEYEYNGIVQQWQSYIVHGGCGCTHAEPKNQWYFLDFCHVCTSYKPNLCTHRDKNHQKKNKQWAKRVGLHPL